MDNQQNQMTEQYQDSQQFPQQGVGVGVMNQEMEYDQQPDYYPSDDQYDGGQDDPSLYVLERTKSKAQYEIRDLWVRIQGEIRKIVEQTLLGIDWAFILYSSCGWKNQLWQSLFLNTDKDGKMTESHKKFINYTDKYISSQGVIGTGECPVCALENQTILRNICGHEFCQSCWVGHLRERYRSGFTEPFPPCMDESCQVKVSYTMIKALDKYCPGIEQKFFQVLCRSYSTSSREVKVCHGRPGVSCNNCFCVTKMFEIIECQMCGNFVCPRCGEQNHGSCVCYYVRNWKKLTEQSTDFVQRLNYKKCPSCLRIIERKQGCNSVHCPCGQEMCFVCGEKWLPNHTQHGDTTCYRYQEIQMLKEQGKKKEENSKQYFDKIQERKAKLDSLMMQFQRIYKLKRTGLTDIKQGLLKAYNLYPQDLDNLSKFCTFLQKCLCVQWGLVLSLFFEQDKRQEYSSKLLDNNMDVISNFLLQFIEKTYKTLQKEPHEWSKEEIRAMSVEGKRKFQEELRSRNKVIPDIIANTEKIIEGIDTYKF